MDSTEIAAISHYLNCPLARYFREVERTDIKKNTLYEVKILLSQRGGLEAVSVQQSFLIVCFVN